MKNTADNLERFIRAQQDDYDIALREVRNGKKRSHWMWYVFPQMRGLGRSGTADYYGIDGLDEAKAYLDNPVLGPRLVEISMALMDLETKDATRIFGYPDVLKLRSCMTLFAVACKEENSVFRQVLDAYFHGEPDEQTLNLLKRA